MFKTITAVTAAVMIISGAGAAWAEATSFSISVTIPPMIFFDQKALAPGQAVLDQQGDSQKNIQQQALVRDNKKVLMTSAVVL